MNIPEMRFSLWRFRSATDAAAQWTRLRRPDKCRLVFVAQWSQPDGLERAA
jgi:hypothetical protein